MTMKFGRGMETLVLVLTVVFVLTAVYFALIYTALTPMDVTPIARTPSKYQGAEYLVMGAVEDWDGNQHFNLTDLKTPNFKLAVTHDGDFPAGFGNGERVTVTGALSDGDGLNFESTKIEMLDEPEEGSGWNAPYAQNIFYFHVPSAWVSFLAFGVVFIASTMFLKKGGRNWDTLAFASAEIGVVFCTLAIISGPIWGKAEWGKYWRWEDTKLTITFILWLIYIAYLIFRGGAESEDKSRLAAVFGIIGFACVPLSFVSSRIWYSFHPNVVASSSGSMSSESGMGLLLGVIAFTFVYIFMLRKRLFIAKLKYKIEELKEEIGGI